MILLYYKYVQIQDPEAIRKWQRALCEKLQLTGRIILAHEGINGTVGGTDEQCQAYIDAMNAHELFQNIDFKTSPGDASAFPKLKISVKEEIVRLGVDPNKVTVKDTGIHLNPDQTHELIAKKPKDLVILDTRNDYEWKIGRFEGAITPPIKTFRELPQYFEENADKFKDKEVLMNCTGGVRCERATALLQQKGIAKKIYQVEGGIHRYVEKYPDGFFKGRNYVFDNRISVKVSDDILANCELCEQPCDIYINCMNALCNKHFIACNSCQNNYDKTCSKACQEKIADTAFKRPEYKTQQSSSADRA